MLKLWHLFSIFTIHKKQISPLAKINKALNFRILDDITDSEENSQGYKWAHVMKNEITIVRKVLWELSWLTLCILCQITESSETGALFSVSCHTAQHSSACGMLHLACRVFFFTWSRRCRSAVWTVNTAPTVIFLLCLQMGHNAWLLCALPVHGRRWEVSSYPHMDC